MADIHRLVRMDYGGQVTQLTNYISATNYDRERGTFKITPGARKTSMAMSSRRYAGGRAVGESHDNGTLSWTVLVDGGAGQSADGALANAENMIAALEYWQPGRYIEWRPDGASRSVFFEVRGPATVQPQYQWVMFLQSKRFVFEVSVPVAPLARLAPMDIYDGFTVNSLTDYTADATGAGFTWNSSGYLTLAANATESRSVHTARNYYVTDQQVTTEFTPGSGISGFKGGIVLRKDASNYVDVYVDDNGTNSRLRIDIIVAGVRTNRASTNLAARVVNATKFTLRARREGNIVTAEYFLAAATVSPMGTVTTTNNYTLAGGELTACPDGIGGLEGIAPVGSSNVIIDNFFVEPFTYRNQTLPRTISLGGTIPGSAPALADFELTPSGGSAAPIWAMLGWTKRPGTQGVTGTAAPPWGIVESNHAAVTLTTFASTADAACSGGNKASVTTSGAGTGSVDIRIDPSMLAPDDFSYGELDIEVWAKVGVASTVAAPTLTASLRPATSSLAQIRYTQEFGSTGKLLASPSSGTPQRLVRLGVITVAVGRARPAIAAQMLRVAAAWASGSSGEFSIDYVELVPAQMRALNQTGISGASSSYPQFVQTTTETTKQLCSDLSASAAVAANYSARELYADAGLGGAVIELPPAQAAAGLIDVLAHLASRVPDDPTVDTGAMQLNHSATVHVAVTPRVFIAST